MCLKQGMNSIRIYQKEINVDKEIQCIVKLDPDTLVIMNLEDCLHGYYKTSCDLQSAVPYI